MKPFARPVNVRFHQLIGMANISALETLKIFTTEIMWAKLSYLCLDVSAESRNCNGTTITSAFASWERGLRCAILRHRGKLHRQVEFISRSDLLQFDRHGPPETLARFQQPLPFSCGREGVHRAGRRFQRDAHLLWYRT